MRWAWFALSPNKVVMKKFLISIFSSLQVSQCWNLVDQLQLTVSLYLVIICMCQLYHHWPQCITYHPIPATMWHLSRCGHPWATVTTCVSVTCMVTRCPALSWPLTRHYTTIPVPSPSPVQKSIFRRTCCRLRLCPGAVLLLRMLSSVMVGLCHVLTDVLCGTVPPCPLSHTFFCQLF